MEIDIPDLNDVSFIQDCVYCRGTKKTYRWDETAGPRKGKRQRPTGETVEDACRMCNETGVELSPVGKRLLEFLDKVTNLTNRHGWQK